jgi:ribosomal protein S14
LDERRTAVWFEPRAYRCERCGETSPGVYSQRELDEVRYAHRKTAHGGFIPDGEVIIEPERMRLADLPREQKVFGVVALVVIVLSVLFKIA